MDTSNPQKISALVEALKERYGEQRAAFVVAFGKNKMSTVKESIACFVDQADSIVATGFILDDGGPRRPLLASSVMYGHHLRRSIEKITEHAT